MKNFVFHRDFDKEVLDFFELVGRVKVYMGRAK